MERRQNQGSDKPETVSQPQNENRINKASSNSIFTTITLFNIPHRTQVPSFPTLDEPSTKGIITLWSETPTTHSVVRAWYTHIQTVFLSEIDGEIHTPNDESAETTMAREIQETSTDSETSIADETTTASETTTTSSINSETLLSSKLPSTSSEVLVPSSTWSTSYTTSSTEMWSTSTLITDSSNPPTSDSHGISTAEGVGISVGATCGFLLILGSVLLVVFRSRLSDEPLRSSDNQNNISIKLDNGPFDHTIAEPQAAMPNEWKAS
ncbi:uncharacterized protein FTOL_01406 [Fusarium torulosum]|uniref:Mid2 domain-containing protein n=1 Tax=Fusarium torulosum TaxID=33205 RepID=A0AAE8M0D0_9HYPO|nr:uncharacterized protein FTOL_01406 [Fusarium torulosum]